jgi:DNA-binding LacI/PurR family transcriptional regulator
LQARYAKRPRLCPCRSGLAGIKVPDDLAVIGFDGIPEAEFYSPPLSTIYQNQDEVGRTAVQELIRLIDEQLDNEQEILSRQITIEPELIIRESTKKL